MNERNSTPTPSVSGHNKLDPIAVLREELAAAALCHGVERMEDLTDELVLRYVQRLGGVHVYVPGSALQIAGELHRKYVTALMVAMPASCLVGLG